MGKRIVFCFMLLLFTNVHFSQKANEINFQIKDLETGAPVRGNHVKILNSDREVILDTLVGESFTKTFYGKKREVYEILVNNGEVYDEYYGYIYFDKTKVTNYIVELDKSTYYIKQKIAKNELKNKEEDAIYGAASEIQDIDIMDASIVDSEFPGGIPELHKFIHTNVIYPERSRELGEQGTVYIEFIVEKDGSISHVSILKSVSPELDYESIRLVRSFPKFTPMRYKGEIIRSRCKLPVKFILN